MACQQKPDASAHRPVADACGGSAAGMRPAAQEPPGSAKAATDVNQATVEPDRAGEFPVDVQFNR